MHGLQLDRAALAQEPASGVKRLGHNVKRVTLALSRLLTEREPVDREPLAARAGVGPDVVAHPLDEHSGAYSDQDGQMFGFQGLGLARMPL